jgi:hypothetical protein
VADQNWNTNQAKTTAGKGQALDKVSNISQAPA